MMKFRIIIALLFACAGTSAWADALPLACSEKCVTPFAEVLGNADGAEGYSNCKSSCVNPKFSFMNIKTGEISIYAGDPNSIDWIYVGLIYQCVEYARKWWMLNKGIAFDGVDTADKIFNLKSAKNIRSNEAVFLERSLNVESTRPPMRGDLIVYAQDMSKPILVKGHVAVVVDVALKRGEVFVAEQNYLNAAWEEPNTYSRKLRLLNNDGHYTLLDAVDDENGGQVSGWIYPAK